MAAITSMKNMATGIATSAAIVTSKKEVKVTIQITSSFTLQGGHISATRIRHLQSIALEQFGAFLARTRKITSALLE